MCFMSVEEHRQVVISAGMQSENSNSIVLRTEYNSPAERFFSVLHTLHLWLCKIVSHGCSVIMN